MSHAYGLPVEGNVNVMYDNFKGSHTHLPVSTPYHQISVLLFSFKIANYNVNDCTE